MCIVHLLNEASGHVWGREKSDCQNVSHLNRIKNIPTNPEQVTSRHTRPQYHPEFPNTGMLTNIQKLGISTSYEHFHTHFNGHCSSENTLLNLNHVQVVFHNTQALERAQGLPAFPWPGNSNHRSSQILQGQMRPKVQVAY